MKTKNTLRTLLSLAMVFTMLLSCGGFSAFAATEGLYKGDGHAYQDTIPSSISETVEHIAVQSHAENSGTSTNVHVEGDVNLSLNPTTPAIGVYDQAVKSAEASITVDGGIVVYEGNTSDNPGNVADGVYSSIFEDSSGKVIIGDDIDVTGEGHARGISASASSLSELEIEAGSVSVEADNNATGVQAWSAGISTTDVKITDGDIDVVSHNASGNNGAVAITVGSSDSKSTTKLQVTDGDVSAEGGQTSIGVDADNTQGTTVVTVSGEVSADGKTNAVGIEMGGSGDFTMQSGSVSAESDMFAKGIAVQPEQGGSATIQVNGNVNAEGDQQGIGINALGTDPGQTPGTININVSGKVDADSDMNAKGILARTGEGDLTEIKVGGDVTADGGRAVGIEIYSDNAETEIEVGGNVTADGENAIGIDIESYNAESEIEVGGDVIAKANDTDMVIGIDIYGENAENEVEVGGNVISDGDGIWIDQNGEEDEVEVTIDGNVEAEGEFGIAINQHAKDGKTEVTVKGNVKGGDEGLLIRIPEDNAETKIVNDILVNGTIEGGKAGVAINQAVTTDNFKLTVYEIKLNEDGDALVGKDDYPDSEYTNENTRAVEESIMYIIKIEQPAEGGTLKAVKEDGSALDQSHGLDVAREGDTVMMKVDLAPGYVVTGAYSVDGHELNIYEKNGQYYVEVPKGGGVYVSARVEKSSDDNGGGNRVPDIPVLVPVSAGESGFAGAFWTDGVQYVDVVFDYNGGHKPASLFAGPVVKTVPAGTWVVLVDPPVREDADFVCWQSDNEDVTVSKPGQNFCVTEPVVFTAVWSDGQMSEETAEVTAAQVVLAVEEAADVAIEDAEQEETAAAEEKAGMEDAAVSVEGAALSLDGGETTISISGDAAAVSLANLLNGDGSGLQAKLVVDLGDGNSLEIPVNIQLSLGTPTIVTSAA